jgi:hypothetical protein
MLIAGWAVALFIFSIATPASNALGWFALAVVWGVPTLVLLRLWRVPELSTSERVQKVLR